MPTDTELLVSYSKHGSQEAFAEFVRRHMNFVFATALRQVGNDAHLADDVSHYVFVRVAQKAGALAHHPTLRGWLYSTACNASANVIRTERRRRVREAKAHFMQETINPINPTPPSTAEDLRFTIDRALDALSDRDQEAVLLRFFEGRDYAEIGASFSVTADAARLRIERALEKMRGVLSRHGVSSTTAALTGTLTSQAAVTAPVGLAESITTTVLAGVISGGGAVSALTFMSITSKTVAGAASLVAAAAISFTVFQAKNQRNLDAALVSIRAERDALAIQRDKLQAEMNRSQREGKLAAASASTPPGTSAPAGATAAMLPGSPRQQVAADQGLRPIFLAKFALEMRTRYDPFFDAAGLSSEQRDRFVKLAIRPMSMNLDLDQALAALGPNPDQSAMTHLMENVKKQAAEAKVDATDGMRQLLGDQAYQQYQQYQKTLGERAVAENLAGHLYQTSAPISAAQGSQIVELLAQTRFDSNSSSSSPGNSMAGVAISPDEFANYSRGNNSPLGSLITDAAIVRAQTILTPDQLAALQRLQAQQLLEIQLQPNRAKRRGP